MVDGLTVTISVVVKDTYVYSNYNRAAADSYDGGHIDMYGGGFDGCSDVSSFSDGTFSSSEMLTLLLLGQPPKAQL